jgi:hypothetical protein
MTSECRPESFLLHPGQVRDWRSVLLRISHLESVHDSKIDLQAAANASSCPRSHEVARNAHKAPL